MSTEKTKFDLGDIVNIATPYKKELARFVVCDLMADSIDVYFYDETGLRGTSKPIGRYELVDHDPLVSRRLRAIDGQIAALKAERQKIIDDRLNEESIFD